VEIDSATFELLDVRVVADREPIYFGLTSSDDEVFCVGRNLDLKGSRIEPDGGVNRILAYRRSGLLANPTDISPVRQFALGEGLDLHQIRWCDGKVLVVTPCSPNLLIVDPASGAVERMIDLDAIVPRHLAHPPLPNRGEDLYHFNSVSVGENGQIFVLAHNWNEGAFALVLDPENFCMRGCYTNLGQENHDVFDSGGELFSLNSRGNELVEARSNARYPLRDSGHFPRGLAANDSHLFIGFGRLQSDREKRSGGQSGIVVWSWSTRSVIREIPLGSYGDVCDVLLLSEPDLTDRSASR